MTVNSLTGGDGTVVVPAGKTRIVVVWWTNLDSEYVQGCPVTVTGEGETYATALNSSGMCSIMVPAGTYDVSLTDLEGRDVGVRSVEGPSADECIVTFYHYPRIHIRTTDPEDDFGHDGDICLVYEDYIR